MEVAAIYAVFTKMRRPWQDLEIFRAVIMADSVDVVNMFVAVDGPAENVFHDDDVLIDLTGAIMARMIAPVVEPYIAVLVDNFFSCRS